MRSQPCIAYVLDRFPVLSEQFVSREIAALRGLGADVKVLTLQEVGLQHAPSRRALLGAWGLLSSPRRAATLLRESSVLARAGVPVLHLVKRILDAARIAARLPKQRPLLLHAHFATAPATTARLVAAACGLPWGVSVHARDLFAEHELLEQRLSTAAYVVACTATGAERARVLLGSRSTPVVTEIRHGIERRSYCPERNGAHVLAAGRFVRKKGFHVLLEALARLSDGGIAFTAHLVGDGPEKANLQTQLCQLNLTERVELGPWIQAEALARAMGAASVLVVPSIIDHDGDRDGIPNVLVEALASGLPVIASRLPAIEEANKWNAICMVAPDDPEQLAGQLQALLTSSADRSHLSTLGLETAGHLFDLNQNASALLDVMLATLASRRLSDPTRNSAPRP